MTLKSQFFRITKQTQMKRNNRMHDILIEREQARSTQENRSICYRLKKKEHSYRTREKDRVSTDLGSSGPSEFHYIRYFIKPHLLTRFGPFVGGCKAAHVPIYGPETNRSALLSYFMNEIQR